MSGVKVNQNLIAALIIADAKGIQEKTAWLDSGNGESLNLESSTDVIKEIKAQ